MIELYRLLSNFYPKNIKKRYRQLLTYSHITINPDRFMGFMIFFGLGIGIASSLFLGAFSNMNIILLFFASFFGVELLVYMTLILRADKKAKFVEEILPDALQLMASNLRAGFTIDKAILLSARPEFGPLADEINHVGKEITLGKELSDSLLKMTERIRSERLEKTMILIVSGLKSGGQLASLLEQTAKNLRHQMFVDERVRANVMMYVIFIFSAVGFASPMLFGLSSFLVEVLTKNLANLDLSQASSANLPMSFSQVAISVSFIIHFAILALIVNSVLGSLLLGMISKGKAKRGISYMPILICVSISVFFFTRFVIKNMLGGLFGF